MRRFLGIILISFYSNFTFASDVPSLRGEDVIRYNVKLKEEELIAQKERYLKALQQDTSHIYVKKDKNEIPSDAVNKVFHDAVNAYYDAKKQ